MKQICKVSMIKNHLSMYCSLYIIKLTPREERTFILKPLGKCITERMEFRI